MYWMRTHSALWISGLALVGLSLLYARGELGFPLATAGFGVATALVVYTLIARRHSNSEEMASTPELIYFFAPF